MGYGIRVLATGSLALFTRPEEKTERVSYDCITPSAARGLLESVYWHPGLRWKIDKIHVINPIKFTSVRRNEVQAICLSSQVLSMALNNINAPSIVASDNIIQRASMLLTDVRYTIEAHFEITDKADEGDTPEKFYSIVRRRLLKGQTYSHPYLGCREFPATLTLIDDNEELPKGCYERTTKELGMMLYDIDYTNPQNLMPMFFHAVMKNGVIDLTNCEVYKLA